MIPKIDRRTEEELVPELRRLIYKYCSKEWSHLSFVEADKKVDALVHIFTNMLGKVIERLNKAPEKNFISFLTMLGIGPTPPRAAKAPLIFTRKADWDKLSSVPAGSKVSAQPDGGQEVIFETEKELTVIRPKLVRAVSLVPNNDKWSNQDFLFSEEASGQTAVLFEGDSTVVHRLYVGHAGLLGYREPGSQLTIHFNKPGKAQLKSSGHHLDMDWFYFDTEGNRKQLQPSLVREYTDDFWRASYQFDTLPAFQAAAVSGYNQSEELQEWNNKWIYAELKTPITKESSMPDIEAIMMELSLRNPVPLLPEAAVNNGIPLDISKDFYPFGEKPKINDTFYFACDEAFTKEGAAISVNIELSDPNISKLPDTSYVKLSWEYWNGTEWLEISNLHHAAYVSEPESAEEDRTEVVQSAETLTGSGTVYFACPGMKTSMVNGEERAWLRVRLTGGHYGEEAKYEYKDSEVQIGTETVNIARLQVTPASYAPPSIRKLTVDYSYSMESHPETVLTENNFCFDEKTSACREDGVYFKPFYPCSEKDPTFYLAFDEDISGLPVSLFFPFAGEQAGQAGERLVVAWEYWDGRKWMTLSVNDAIRHFTRREILQIAVPSDMEKKPLFGTEYYWIRARVDGGSYKALPRLDAIYSNVVWARNASTVPAEILGSSNGEADQTFQLSKTPVLPGQTLLVREAMGQEEWIPWEEVDTFSVSGTADRHYTLDRKNGVLVFGNGKNGMIPPTGSDNIKCVYKFGGGRTGNVEAGSITNVWDSFAWLDSAVNPVAADGGFDQEEPEDTQIRGPHTLKSWNRGVTAEDMEWLAREAMPQIAKVKCLSAMNRELEFTPGRATIIIVPEQDGPKPTPSQELLSEMEAFLCARTSAVLNTAVPGIEVMGPDYVRIGIEAKVEFTSMEQRKVAEGRIIDNLKQFFHPLYGGDQRVGWELGQNLYVSEVYAVIKGTPGVDFVSDIAVKASVQCFTLRIDPLEYGPYKPLCAYPKHSSVRTDDNKIVFGLAEGVEAGADIKTLMVKGFKEKTTILLKHQGYEPVNLTVDAIDGDILVCSLADGEDRTGRYPAGSDVEYKAPGDLIIRSFIRNETEIGPGPIYLKVALLEPKDIVYLSRPDEYVNTTPLRIHEVRSENIFLEDYELICGGTHFINKKNEIIFPYLLDKGNNLLHDLTGTQTECYLEQVSKEERVFLQELEHAPDKVVPCPYCLSAVNSDRG